jgi:hypothetical protein
MNGLSDLDMVAQAMATTTRFPADQSDAPQPHTNASNVPSDLDLVAPNTQLRSGLAPDDETNGVALPEDLAAELDKLSVEDKAALGPLLELLVASGSGADGKDLEDLLKQFDAADDVADKLEGRLDDLLQGLKGVEGELGVIDEESPAEETDRPEAMADEAKEAFGGETGDGSKEQ